MLPIQIVVPFLWLSDQALKRDRTLEAPPNLPLCQDPLQSPQMWKFHLQEGAAFPHHFAFLQEENYLIMASSPLPCSFSDYSVPASLQNICCELLSLSEGWVGQETLGLAIRCGQGGSPVRHFSCAKYRVESWIGRGGGVFAEYCSGLNGGPSKDRPTSSPLHPITVTLCGKASWLCKSSK